jgi:hypothetical protein
LPSRCWIERIDLAADRARGGNGSGSDAGATGGTSAGGVGGSGGTAGSAMGGGVYNGGGATLTNTTGLTILSNGAFGDQGGSGGTGGLAISFQGGNGGGSSGGNGGAGGAAFGNHGGDGGLGGEGLGGGLFNAAGGTVIASLLINPRLHARKGSKQSKATDLITSNQALSGTGESPGSGGAATAGAGGSPGGANGVATQGANGVAHPLSIGSGGGIFAVATAVIDFTSITGNTASTLDNDVDGSVSQ